jgi:hypothetical protein
VTAVTATSAHTIPQKIGKRYSKREKYDVMEVSSVHLPIYPQSGFEFKR